MPDLFSLIWMRADAKEPRFSADEMSTLAGGAADRLAASGLIRQIENAASIACDACADQHVEEVAFVESPRGAATRAYISCPDNGRVHVPLERLKQWEVDFGGMAIEVARTLEVAGTVEEVAPGRVWFLGKTTIAARSREIFLARGLTWEDARTVLGSASRLNAASCPLVLAAGEVPPTSVWNGDAPPVAALKIVVTLGKECLTVDRAHLESLLSTGRKKAPDTSLKSFPTPAGTIWSEVRLVVNENSLRIEAREKRKAYTFQEAGFAERRRKGSVPDRLWELLKLFAVHCGVLPFKKAEAQARRNVKQYVSDLRDRLSALLPGLDGDPISFDKAENAYRTAFKLSSEEGVTFAAPPGTSWEVVSISKIDSSTVRISVTASARFASRTYSKGEEASQGSWESAEGEGQKQRDFDLRTLGLADEQGRLNRAGQAMLGVLAGNGSVKRKADDKGMLDLCGVLTRLLEIKDSPFRFASIEEKWVARFEIGNDE